MSELTAEPWVWLPPDEPYPDWDEKDDSGEDDR